MEAVTSCSRLFTDKRKRDSSPEGNVEHWIWKRKQALFCAVVGSDSEGRDTEGAESVHSVQGQSTDCAVDTSDTSTKSTLSDNSHYNAGSFSEDTYRSEDGFTSDSSDARKHFLPVRSRRKKLLTKHRNRRDESQPTSYSCSAPKVSSESRRRAGGGGVCGACRARPKDGGYNHGSVVHVHNCYACSVESVERSGGRCPICDTTVRRVVRLMSF